jgi:hypothetical protein
MVAAGTLLVAAMAAYVADRRHFPGKSLYVTTQASMMFISIGAIVLRPQFDLMVVLHLNTTLWGVILILISAHSSTFFMLLGFFKAIPRELDEAAMVDGSGFVRTFFRIVLPLLAPGLGVAGLLAFRHAWNEERIHSAAGVHDDESAVADARRRAGQSPLRFFRGHADPFDDGGCMSIHPADAARLYCSEQVVYSGDGGLSQRINSIPARGFEVVYQKQHRARCFFVSPFSLRFFDIL